MLGGVAPKAKVSKYLLTPNSCNSSLLIPSPDKA